MQNQIRTLIIDDEPFARESLRIFLSEHPEFEIIGECTNGLEAVEFININKPDLIFLDIQMPELSGFDVLNEIDAANMPVIIFATAYDKYALKAFDANAVDYLLKPFSKPRFEEALLKAVKFLRGHHQENIELIKKLLRTYDNFRQQEEQFINRILVKEKKKYFFIKLEEVYYFEASSDYVIIHKEKTKHWINESMSNLESRLDPNHFIRIHRSTIINVNYIEDLQPYFNGEFFITLKNGDRLKLSRNYKDKIKSLFSGHVM